jgi:hypothetical protein
MHETIKISSKTWDNDHSSYGIAILLVTAKFSLYMKQRFGGTYRLYLLDQSCKKHTRTIRQNILKEGNFSDNGRRGSAALTTRHPYIHKIWH